MAKKYRLDIPVKILRWVEPELRKRQGKIQVIWSDDLYDLGWLTEIKEPLSFEEWFIKNSYNYGGRKTKIHMERAWNAALIHARGLS